MAAGIPSLGRWLPLALQLLLLSLGTTICAGRLLSEPDSERAAHAVKSSFVAGWTVRAELDEHAGLARRNETRKVRWLDIQHPADLRSKKGTGAGVGLRDIPFVTCETSDASPFASDATDAANHLISLNMQSCCNNNVWSCCTTMFTSGTAVLDICSDCNLEYTCLPCRVAGNFILDVINQCNNPTTSKVGGTINIQTSPPYMQFQIYHT